MKSRTLTVVAMFLASALVGYNMFPSIQSVQAAPQLNPLVVELPQLNLPSTNDPQPESAVIDVEYNLETQELTVHGNTDAQVNFRTVGEVKPIVKWKTKIKEVEVPVEIIKEVPIEVIKEIASLIRFAESFVVFVWA